MEINTMNIGIIGAGAMGSGIAQTFAQNGYNTILLDANPLALETAEKNIISNLEKLVSKSKITLVQSDSTISKLSFTKEINDFKNCDLVIEAIVEDVEVKRNLFVSLENILSAECIIATNTSSLSVTALAAACTKNTRVVGIHFFNPATIMQLVEIIPALQTNIETVNKAVKIIKSIGKTTVIAKDTPGFIVNKVARPFYSESIKIFEEGTATIEEIDYAMKAVGFRMGPFQLMDMIGHDVNFAVTNSVFKGFFFDGRYKPSLAQQKLVEAGYLGIKSNKGFYNYPNKFDETPPIESINANAISNRVLVMLFNEAWDTVFQQIATEEDIDLAMTKGVNYPKGLIAWSIEYGLRNVVSYLDELYNQYREERYRCSPLLRRKAVL
jgi:3-hydroxybutyryl-CoA dehydrogenase